MSPAELAAHKNAPKRLSVTPHFVPTKSKRLPKPFDKMRGARLHTTGEVEVGASYRMFLFWRDGELLSDSAFYGWLMLQLPTGVLSPVLEFHYHPSHKGVHVKVPSNTPLDHTQRLLVQAPELRLKTREGIDPRKPEHRQMLIHDFCTACGINLGEEADLWT